MDLSWFGKPPPALDDRASDVVTDPARTRIIRTMVELFVTQGYSDLKSRLFGKSAPQVLRGSVSDHRPDIVGVWRPTSRTMLCDVVMPDVCSDPKRFDERLGLLGDTARLYGAEVHFACPAARLTRDRGTLSEWLKRRLAQHGIVAKVWEL